MTILFVVDECFSLDAWICISFVVIGFLILCVPFEIYVA